MAVFTLGPLLVNSGNRKKSDFCALCQIIVLKGQN